MPALTRRRDKDRQQETWAIFYGDVQVGTIGERAGVPKDVDQWGWSYGFYPRAHRLTDPAGTAETFDQARAAFDAAWRTYLPGCSEEDFRVYRWQRDWTAWKYRMHDVGLPLPTQWQDGRAWCHCGDAIDVASLAHHVSAHHSNLTGPPSADRIQHVHHLM